MKRNFSGWGVTVAGLLLAAGGVYAMLTGWDMILVERGWSLFIAGSVAISGGVVTAALGRVIAHLARLAAPVQGAAPAPVRQAAEPVEQAAPAYAAPTPVAPPQQPSPPSAAPLPHYAAPPSPDPLRMLAAAHAQEEQRLVEVDRYTAGDATYVMLSDGSVEVRSPSGAAQRYSSLAALRAEAEGR